MGQTGEFAASSLVVRQAASNEVGWQTLFNPASPGKDSITCRTLQDAPSCFVWYVCEYGSQFFKLLWDCCRRLLLSIVADEKQVNSQKNNKRAAANQYRE